MVISSVIASRAVRAVRWRRNTSAPGAAYTVAEGRDLPAPHWQREPRGLMRERMWLNGSVEHELQNVADIVSSSGFGQREILARRALQL